MNENQHICIHCNYEFTPGKCPCKCGKCDDGEIKKAAVTIFEHPKLGQLATVVMDREEFDALCDEFKSVMITMKLSEAEADIQIASCKAASTVPMIIRGKQTDKFFTRYDIKVNKMSCIVRGQGKQVLNNIVELVQEQQRRNAELN